jgi:type IV pilus modification protein PilV
MQLKNKQSGVAMLESLIAFLIIVFGLLGIGALQSIAIGSTKVAADRSLASIQTSALLSRINSNDLFWQTITPNFDIGISSAGVISDLGGTGEGDALEALGTDCSANVCTPQETAAYSIKSWATTGSSFGGNGGMQDRLPAASARIRRIGVDFPVMLEVSVTWNETRATSGLNMASTYYTDTGSAANAQRDFTYTVRARP